MARRSTPTHLFVLWCGAIENHGNPKGSREKKNPLAALAEVHPSAVMLKLPNPRTKTTFHI